MCCSYIFNVHKIPVSTIFVGYDAAKHLSVIHSVASYVAAALHAGLYALLGVRTLKISRVSRACIICGVWRSSSVVMQRRRAPATFAQKFFFDSVTRRSRERGIVGVSLHRNCHHLRNQRGGFCVIKSCRPDIFLKEIVKVEGQGDSFSRRRNSLSERSAAAVSVHAHESLLKTRFLPIRRLPRACIKWRQASPLPVSRGDASTLEKYTYHAVDTNTDTSRCCRENPLGAPRMQRLLRSPAADRKSKKITDTLPTPQENKKTSKPRRFPM